MKFDFSKIKLTDIEGKPLKKSEVHKSIANALWMSAKKLDLVEVAMEINRGKAVALEKEEVAEVKRLVDDDKQGFLAFARKAVHDYIESVQKKAKADKK